MNKVAVIDYGMGNLHSVTKAIEHAGTELKGETKVFVTSDAHEISQADRVIFPGVGAIRDCMAEIRRLKVDHIILEAITKKPVLAICVGMQALMLTSEENDGVECLGVIKGKVKHFGDPLMDHNGKTLKVPHMGWNQVSRTKAHPLWRDIPDDSRFYFVHSYYVKMNNDSDIAGSTDYICRYTSAASCENVFATQFHPEKSQIAGLTLLKNFLNWNGNT